MVKVSAFRVEVHEPRMQVWEVYSGCRIRVVRKPYDFHTVNMQDEKPHMLATTR